MSITETFSNSIDLAVIKEYDKGHVMQISTVFGHVYHIEVSSETWLFRHLSNYVFGIRNLENTKSMTVTFFSKFLKFNLDFKNAAKTEKRFFVSEKIASELVSLNNLY